MRTLAITVAMAIVLAPLAAAEATPKRPQHLGPTIHDPSIGEWVQGRPDPHGQSGFVDYNMGPAIHDPYIGEWVQGRPRSHERSGFVGGRASP